MVLPKTTIELTYPFEHAGEQVTCLTLRRPKVRDLKRAAAAADDSAGTFRMIGDLAEVPPELLDEIDAEDFAKVTDWLEGVLPKPKPSPAPKS